MNARERFHAVMSGEPADRLPFMEFMGFWPETLDRWHGEGLPAHVQTSDFQLGGERRHVAGEWVDPKEFFGFDKVEMLPVDFNPLPVYARQVLEEDAETRLVRDEVGVTKREFKTGSAMPHYVDFPIADRASFERYRERLDATDPARYPADWSARLARDAARDYPAYLIIRGPFAFCRDFMDFNSLMMTCLTDPELIREMMTFQVDFTITLWERAVRELAVDFVYIGEDMAYKNGPMLSPALAEDLMAPLYRRLVGFLRESGVRHIIVDSDGDIRPLLPMLVREGLTGVLPMEAAAGCDVVELRTQYPKLQMVGGLNKLQLARGRDAIDAELARVVQGIKRGGRYIPCFDHSVPPIISYADYGYYLDRLRDAITLD